MAFDKKARLEEIDEALSHLQQPQLLLLAESSNQHLWVNRTLLDTIYMLTLLANYLDKGSRELPFDNSNAMNSIFPVIARSFFSSVAATTEEALKEFCKDRGIELVASKKKKAVKKFEDLKPRINVDVLPDVEKVFYEQVDNFHPNLLEYVSKATEIAGFTDARRTFWYSFFDSLRIVRNRSAHTNAQLKDDEIATLIANGFEKFLNNRVLVMYPIIYHQVIYYIFNFLNELQKQSNKSNP